MKLWPTFASLGAVALLSACAPPPPKTTLNFSILSTESASSSDKAWEPFIADMRKTTGLDIKPFYASNYAILVEAMAYNKTQVGWFGNASALEAVQRAEGEVFAHSTDSKGRSSYHSIMLARKDRGLTLDRMMTCDKTLAYGRGDALSTSGTLAPLTYLFAPRGTDPESCFKTVMSANHQANALAVANGSVDAAAVDSIKFEKLQRTMPEVASRLTIIWTSPDLPLDPLVRRKDLAPDVKAKLDQFFASYGRSQGAEGERQRTVLKALAFGPFERADDRFLLPVRRMKATAALQQAQNKGDASAIATAKAQLVAVATEEAAIPTH